MKVEANTLQEAFQKAADKLGCSVTELEIEVIQHPRSGFLGAFKKLAIIEAKKEGTKERKRPAKKLDPKPKTSPKATKETENTNDEQRKERSLIPIDQAVKQIDSEVKSLMSKSCFDIEVTNVAKYDEDTILIELNGEDSALLIGKEGYRYKAISYLLYSWISLKFGYCIRLEIAQFLQNQEAMIEKYLKTIIEKVEKQGKAQTKPLDGVLVKIALEQLRAKFPDKYVGIKLARNGAKFVVVNEFNKK